MEGCGVAVGVGVAATVGVTFSVSVGEGAEILADAQAANISDSIIMAVITTQRVFIVPT